MWCSSHRSKARFLKTIHGGQKVNAFAATERGLHLASRHFEHFAVGAFLKDAGGASVQIVRPTLHTLTDLQSNFWAFEQVADFADECTRALANVGFDVFDRRTVIDEIVQPLRGFSLELGLPIGCGDAVVSALISRTGSWPMPISMSLTASSSVMGAASMGAASFGTR